MLGTKTMIVLSSDVAVKDLLDRKSGNYSDRPDMYIGQNIASGGLRLVLLVSQLPGRDESRCPSWKHENAAVTREFHQHIQIACLSALRLHPILLRACAIVLTLVQRYGETWRMIHRMIHNILNIKAAVTYVPYQDLENKMMLVGFLDSPENFLDHLRRYTFSLSTQIIFGYRCSDIRDPNLQQLFWVSDTWKKTCCFRTRG